METDLTAANMLYAMVSTGFLPGNVQVGTVTTNGGSSIDFHADARFSSAHQLAYIYQVYSGTNAAAYGEVGAQWIGDLSVGWTSANGKLSLTDYVRNIGDNRYKQSVHLTGLGPSFAPTETPYDPRTVGVILHVGI